MSKALKIVWWLIKILAGTALYAFGFSFFLKPYNMNAGGLSGLAMVVLEVLGNFGIHGSVGTLVAIVNIPLVLIGGLRVNRRFFVGTAIAAIVVSPLIDLFALLPTVPALAQEPLLASLYGGVTCGAGLGMVFLTGASTGGSDVVVRLLKLRFQNLPIGMISIMFDSTVLILTSLVFQDLSKGLYSAITVFVTGKIIDMVVYSFDFSKVAMIVSTEHEKIAQQIGRELKRGATYLLAEGSYGHTPKKVVLTAVKKQQISELKRLVSEIDPNAFVIVQEAHQVLGDGFSKYSRDSL